MKKKILSLFMVVIMIMGMMPTLAFADTEVQLDPDSLVKVTVNGEIQPNTAYLRSGKINQGASVSGNEIVISTVDGSKIEYYIGPDGVVTVDADSVKIDLKECTGSIKNTITHADIVNLFKTYGSYYSFQVKLENQSYAVKVYVEYVHNHECVGATCTVGTPCSICGVTGRPLGHKLLGDGTCDACEDTVPAVTVKANGKKVDTVYCTANSTSAVKKQYFYFEIYENSDVEIAVKDGYSKTYTATEVEAGKQSYLSSYKNTWQPPESTGMEKMCEIKYTGSGLITGGSFDYYIVGVKAHPEHTYANGECSLCGKADPLADEKATAKATIKSYKKAADYRDTQKAELTAAVKAANTAIDAIKTDAQLKAEEANKPATNPEAPKTETPKTGDAGVVPWFAVMAVAMAGVVATRRREN